MCIAFFIDEYDVVEEKKRHMKKTTNLSFVYAHYIHKFTCMKNTYSFEYAYMNSKRQREENGERKNANGSTGLCTMVERDKPKHRNIA